MRFKRGFTLVELLVAATIIGFLAVFATVQYRNSVAETRWTQAKAKADQLAGAVQRAQMDYPGISFTSQAMNNPAAGTECSFQSGAEKSPQQLVACQYIEPFNWSGDFFQYFVCTEGAGSNCREEALACVKVKSTAKLPGDYLNYQYCVAETDANGLVGTEWTTQE